MSTNEQEKMDFLAEQHMYAREKEKADSILKKYDTFLKGVQAAALGFIGTFLLVGIQLVANSSAKGLGMFFVFLAILATIGYIALRKFTKKLKEQKQKELDQQLLEKFKR